MPTPFMHLAVAEQILVRLADDGENGRFLSHHLTQHWPAFYLGSVAADLSTVSSVPRDTTHFYTMPPVPQLEAYEEMFAAYPALANPAMMEPNHAVFIAGYAAHLLLDLIWLREIVYAFFRQREMWESHEQRHLAHNILLTYLDQLAQAELPQTAVHTLAAARPQQWLPFAPDTALNDWQAMLVAQLQPGATSQTINIYAQRLGITPDRFAASLQDPAWMEAHVFGKIPVANVQTILQDAVPRSITLISNYFTQ